jgi:hypothetical protein
MENVVLREVQSRGLGRARSEVGLLARYHSIAPSKLHDIDNLRRRANANIRRRVRARNSIKKYASDSKLRPLPIGNSSHNLKGPRVLVDALWRYSGHLTRPQARLTHSNDEIDRITSGPEGIYAKSALARANQITSLLPRIYKSPGNGIALQTSTKWGTINLIIEDEQAILVRASDDFAVQITCNLNPKSLPQLLDIYKGELERIIRS